MLLETDITKYIELHKARYGVELDHDIAQERLSLLVKQMSVIYEPITQQQLDEYVNENVGKNEHLKTTG